MNRRVFVSALACLALPAATAFAHEGHDHKLLGTITEITAARIRGSIPSPLRRR